jgi:crossover junction endodeoxyribonuclease RuvC
VLPEKLQVVVAQLPREYLRVLGVDPGSLRTGWGVVDRHKQSLEFRAGGVIVPKGHLPLPERLQIIHANLVETIQHWTPQVLSLEKAFVAHNVQSAFRLGEVRGVVLLAAAQTGLRVTEHNPTEIKTAVTGYGRADKQQVQKAVYALLGKRTMSGITRQALSLPLSQDATDALAAAICHLNSSQLTELLGEKTSKTHGTGRMDSDRARLLHSAFAKRPLPRSLRMVIKND